MTAVMHTPAERARLRQEVRDRLVAAAEREAYVMVRSPTCGWGRHDTCVGHLPANGQGCLCECHDEPEATP